MHPLSPNLSNASNEELQKKIGELQHRLTYAARIGQHEVVHQVQLLLDDYNNEVSIRNQRALEELESKTKNFKNIIDIK